VKSPYKTGNNPDNSESGGALPFALILISLIIVMTGLIFSGIVMQHRYIQNSIDATQARYTAEGAVFYYLNSDTLVARDSLEVILPDSNRAVIQSEFFGGFLKVTSTAKIGNSIKKVEKLVSKSPDSLYNYAVVLGDVFSRLNATGEVIITGDILTGPLGVRENAFRGKQFSGSLNGMVHTHDGSPLFAYNRTFYDNEADRLERMITDPPPVARRLPPGRYRAEDIMNLTNDGNIIYSEGDLELFTTGKSEWKEPLSIISRGEIILSGNIKYNDYSTFISATNIEIIGELNGNHGLFFAKNGIQIKDTANCSGQFIAGKNIELSGNSYLNYPSVLFLMGEEKDAMRNGQITLHDRSRLDGMAINPLPRSTNTDDQSKIIIGENASVRGAIYNSSKTELHGTVLGSVITFQFYFYHSPTTYINWVKDAEIYRQKRPDNFMSPLGFSSRNSFEILKWKEI